MGFNISVYPNSNTRHQECRYFIDRGFYNFVNSGELYGDKSILIQSGKFYGLDLSPLLKLVYTWDEVSPEYIDENLQTTADLLQLTQRFYNQVKSDPNVCKKVEYIWYEQPLQFSEEERNELINKMGDLAYSYLDSIDKQKQEIEDNPNPWDEYFVTGQILEDLTNLLSSLKCYLEKGVERVYLAAG